MAEPADKIQPIVGTKLSPEEFNNLHILAMMRGESVSEVVTEIIRKELKFRHELIEQAKTAAPKLLEAMQATRFRKGRTRTSKNQNTVNALGKLSDMLSMVSQEKIKRKL